MNDSNQPRVTTTAPPKMRIALLGSRGIPARYGGYETLMEELSRRLCERGHEVTVYCRSHYTLPSEREHHGVRLVVLPTLRTKYLDTSVHTLLSCLHVFKEGYDVALLVNSANAVFLPLLWLRRLPTALHVDGIEKRRAKWGPLGRWIYAASERLACKLPDALVTDAAVIRDHYQRRYAAASTLITYGVDPRRPEGTPTLDRLGLEPRRYFLYVSRFEPENNPHRVVDAYRRVGGDLPLVMVGDAPYANRFITQLRDSADPRVLFPGAIYGDGYRELLSHALAYIHATEVGGTHPALVEAMGYGNCVVVNEADENHEVVGDSGLFFKAAQSETLVEILQRLWQNPAMARSHGERAAKRAAEHYSWDAVCRQYEELFVDMLRRRGKNP